MPTAGEYIDEKREERLKKDRYYWPYFVIAFIFILAGAILAYI
jgi:hypothetical protein